MITHFSFLIVLQLVWISFSLATKYVKNDIHLWFYSFSSMDQAYLMLKYFLNLEVLQILCIAGCPRELTNIIILTTKSHYKTDNQIINPI